MPSFETIVNIAEVLATDGYEIEVKPSSSSILVSCYKEGFRVEMLALCSSLKEADRQKEVWTKALEEAILKGQWEASMRKEAAE